MKKFIHFLKTLEDNSKASSFCPMKEAVYFGLQIFVIFIFFGALCFAFIINL